MDEVDFISFGEAELMVENLNVTPLDKIGGRDWKKQHEYLIGVSTYIFRFL